MIRNVLELHEVNRKELVAEEVATMSRQFLAIVLVALHAVMQ
jgi:hypothetical protein